MPKDLERALRRQARKMFPNDENRQDRFVYGVLRSRFGWTPNTSRRAR